MTPSAAARRKQKPPIELPLDDQKDNRLGLTLMRPIEGAVTLDQTTRFAVLPGPKGKGWVLKVYVDPETKEEVASSSTA